MDLTSVKISVVVPTYRRDKELFRALESLAEQSISDFEIVLVDDNDDPVWAERVKEVAKSFKEKHPKMNLVHLTDYLNRGSAMARNAGVAVSSGEYITFLDDDDVYLPEKLRFQYEFMIENELDFSITELALYFDDGKLSEHRKRRYIEKTDSDSLLQYHMMHHMTGTDTLMFKRAYFDSIGGFPPINVGDEFYLMERAIRGGGKFGFLPRCDVKAFVHRGEGGLSSGQGKIDGENQLYEYKKQFFSGFDKKIERFIRMRHHAVLSFAYLRKRNFLCFAKEAFLSFGASPFACVSMFFKR